MDALYGPAMRPITNPAALQAGATLYHSAFGFASVQEVGKDAVVLSWEREGTHLPTNVRFDALRRVYAACVHEGFFHTALHDREALSTLVHQRPGDGISMLLEDLEGPQRLRDLMDWLVGRGLFTPKTFVRWWGGAEALLKADSRLQWDGEWVQVRIAEREPESSPKLSQLEPNLVDVTDEIDVEGLPPDDYGTDEQTTLVTTPTTLEVAAPFSTADLPAQAFVPVGLAVANALAAAHAEGLTVSPHADSMILQPDGTVRLQPGEAPGHAGQVGIASPEDDIRLAATVLLESFLGRHLPPNTDASQVMPYLRHVLPELPPSALAPLYPALHADPAMRPNAVQWAELWAGVHDTELLRRSGFRSDALPEVGYDSHIGRVKLMQTQTNQDALWVAMRAERGLFVLADGISVSDAGRGDIASRLGINALARLWELVPADEASPRRLVERGLHLGNRAICERSLKAADGDLRHRTPMGTTVTVALTEGNKVHLSWLGDSRAYLVTEQGASQLTADDNVSGARFKAWCEHRGRSWDATGHALTRYLGHFDEDWAPAPFPVHHASFVLLPGESLLLCSDGVTDYIAAHESDLSDELHAAVYDAPPYDATEALLALANRRGGGDNTTAIVIRMPPLHPPEEDVTGW
jgi:serine/threonine protein phosphatase PrpC